LDYEKEGDSGIFLDSVQNVIKAKDKTKEEILKALKSGSFYVLRKGTDNAMLCLDEFKVADGCLLKATYNNGERREIKVNLIKDGKLLYSKEASTPFLLELKYEKSIGRSYYRVEIEGLRENSKLVSNPVFTFK